MRDDGTHPQEITRRDKSRALHLVSASTGIGEHFHIGYQYSKTGTSQHGNHHIMQSERLWSNCISGLLISGLNLRKSRLHTRPRIPSSATTELGMLGMERDAVRGDYCLL